MTSIKKEDNDAALETLRKGEEILEVNLFLILSDHNFRRKRC
jgi:hypothetical protein